MILPESSRGKAVSNLITRGTLKSARRSRRNAATSAAPTSTSGSGSMWAQSVSPNSSSGMPKTAQSHAGHGEQRHLDFGGIDVDAVRDHHVPRAVAYKEIAVLVEIADIAECHEAVAPDLAALVVQAVISEIGNALEPKVNLTHRTRGQGSAIGIVDPDRATGQWPSDGAGLSQRFLGAVDDEGARLSRAVIFVDDRPPRAP